MMFKDEKLLDRALTHRSYVNENPGSIGHNERLEFLGDAILTFISGQYLYQRYPEMGEDEMTRRRSALVDQKQLARFAVEVGIAFKMRLSQGLIKEGGYQNPNLLSSTFEAIVGAYYLDCDQNMEKVRPVIEELFDSVPQEEMIARSNIDSKNRLQELVQAKGAKTPPKYVTKKIGGMDHAPEFMSTVFINDKAWGRGKGRSKKDAEKEAATYALKKLKEKGII
ncbi:ribonuclease III [Roseofilum sp. BLCC_M154]|uniref:Ribonuclease 3 n=1 Tax=Roseofilum acuticapitatum BLCC-M154 TaxID=3022444 RepID=A0ABT7AS19_9CYAN|nr:ribonuclease III [Roseofilum acuticapitatum]MDJ1169696.1 ribonuclease III [Roseofilum acuticapitatum BLCC-M154]